MDEFFFDRIMDVRIIGNQESLPARGGFCSGVSMSAECVSAHFFSTFHGFKIL